MTRDEAVAQIQLMLGFRTSLATQIQTQLIIEQSKLESDATLPWFLRKNGTVIHTSPGDPFIPKPADFIREWDEDPLYMIFESDGEAYNVPLVKDSEAFLRARYNGDESPRGYVEFATQWKLVPTPTQDFSVNYSYYAKEPVLSSNIENNWLKFNHEVLIGRAGMIIATGLRDKAAMEVLGAMAAAGTEKLNSQSTAQDEAGARRVIGGED